MAKQVGPHFFTGTIDGLIFYKLGDNYYVRSKGSYKSARHMRKNPRYTRTMQQADRFGEASNMLKSVYYRCLPKAVRKHGLYGKLTGMINTWLYQGKNVEEVKELLLAHCQQLAATNKSATPATPVVKEQATKPSSNEHNSLSISDQRSTINAQPKRPRYLSRWKVKRNGRLHIPHSASGLLTATHIHCTSEYNSEPHPEVIEGWSNCSHAKEKLANSSAS